MLLFPQRHARVSPFLRTLKLFQSCKAAFERQGFEKDFKIIASATAEDFVNAAEHESQPRSNQDLLRNAGNERVRTALRHLGFSTATVPLTDGGSGLAGFFPGLISADVAEITRGRQRPSAMN